MKRLALAFFLCVSLANATSVGKYILEIYNQPFDIAGDYTVAEIGPDFYQNWVASGLIALVVTWQESRYIQTFDFLPCIADPCVAASRVVFGAGGVPPAGVPEPVTFEMALGGLVVVFVLAFGLRGRAPGD